MEDPQVLGVDIGGSHITVGLVNLIKRKVVSTSIKHRLVDPHGSADFILDSWCEVIEEAYVGYDSSKRIFIALPGPFDYENGICLVKEQDKFKALYQTDIKASLAARLNIPSHTIKFVNDAEAFLKGELFAAPVLYKSVLGITLGTGLGSALYLDGIVKDADLWNSPFEDSIAEEYLASGWFIKRYFELTGLHVTGVKEIEGKVSGDLKAKQVFREFASNLARFLRPLVETHGLCMVIIGGNISYAFEHFSQELLHEISSWPAQLSVRISSLKENAALMGAAAEVLDKKLIGHEL